MEHWQYYLRGRLLELFGLKPQAIAAYSAAIRAKRDFRRPPNRIAYLLASQERFAEAEPYFEVAGIELAEEAAAHGRQSGLNVLSGVADETNLARIGPVHVITMFDVIEHLPEHHRCAGPRRLVAIAR